LPSVEPKTAELEKLGNGAGYKEGLMGFAGGTMPKPDIPVLISLFDIIPVI
jgi:hypothetical protein